MAAMLRSPFRYEEDLTATDFQKIGELLLRCSHIEHIIGNCLKALLRLTDEEAIEMVFPLPIEHRFQRVKKLARQGKLNAEAEAALEGLSGIFKYVQTARNDLAHGIIDESEDLLSFHRRSNQRTVTKEEAFSTEELINYAAHASLALRYALGLKDGPGDRHPLPEAPAVPVHLQK